MSTRRPPILADIKRRVLVEAGHRCAIPTCRATTTEVAHIKSWASSHDNSFENLIALCPNCHTRYDQKKEIDQQSIQMYKENLSILSGRYGETERRLFEWLAETGEQVFVLGPGGDLAVRNAVKDGFFTLLDAEVGSFNLSFSNGFSKSFPMNYSYCVTARGHDFVKRFASGQDIS